MSKITAGQAPSTLISEYIGSDFDAVLKVADNIEAIKLAAKNNNGVFNVPYASEIKAGIAKISQSTTDFARWYIWRNVSSYCNSTC